MSTLAKQEKVQDLKEKLNHSKSVVLTDYRGLSVAKLQELRKAVEENGAEYEITKNSLLARSLGDLETPAEALEGPTATLFSYTDEVAPLKALQDFIKINALPLIKIGFLGKTLLSESQVNELAKLPSREIILSKLAQILKANQYDLVQVLSGNIRRFVYVLDAVSKTKTS